jgi:hypothetical protein
MTIGWKIEFAAKEQNPGSVVLEGAEAPDSSFEGLYPRVEALGKGVGDLVIKVVKKAPEMGLRVSATFFTGPSLDFITSEYQSSKKESAFASSG